MKFFIIGDSWGIGQWESELRDGLHISVENTGLDFHLRDLGHYVTNISAHGAGNYGQLRQAYWTLKEDPEYDYIIWFHSESVRDIEEFLINDPMEGRTQFPLFKMKSDLNSSLQYLNLRNYQYAQAISHEYKIPFIIISGQSPVDESVINRFSFYKLIIPWLKDLLNLSFEPPAINFYGWELFTRVLNYYKIDEISFMNNNLVEKNNSDKILELASLSQKFPDNNHPSSSCYKELALYIDTIVSTYDKRN